MRLSGIWHSIVADVRYAGRTLRKSPAFVAVAVLSIALGVGANTAIFTLVDQVLLRQLPVTRPARAGPRHRPRHAIRQRLGRRQRVVVSHV